MPIMGAPGARSPLLTQTTPRGPIGLVSMLAGPAWEPINQHARSMFDRLSGKDASASEAARVDMLRRVLYARMFMTDCELDRRLLNNPRTPDRTVRRIARRTARTLRNDPREWTLLHVRIAVTLAEDEAITGDLLRDLCRLAVSALTAHPEWDTGDVGQALLRIADTRPGAISPTDLSALLVHTATR